MTYFICFILENSLKPGSLLRNKLLPLKNGRNNLKHLLLNKILRANIDSWTLLVKVKVAM